MATTIKLTKSAIDAVLLPATGQRAVYRFEGVIGLELRVSYTGVKAFSTFHRKAGGKMERVSLGKYPAITPDQARRKALAVVAALAAGQSVSAERQREKLEAKTLKQVMDDYVATRKDLKPRTKKDMGDALREFCPDWLSKPVTKISADLVKKRHKKHGEERSPARANLACRYLRALFNFAAAEYQDDIGKPLVDSNPVAKLSQTKAWFKVERKQTYLRVEDIGPWLNSVLALPNSDMQDYFLTLLLTGLRRTEAMKLTWSDVDLRAKTLICRDPKNGRDHVMPLSDYLFELMMRRKASARSPLVFADSLGRALSNIRYSQETVTTASGIKWSPHDLRRTFVTVAERLDFPFSVLKRLLNHAEKDNVTMGYIGADVERLREPMQKITDYVLRTAGVRETAEVIPLKQARG
jgi:integrase